MNRIALITIVTLLWTSPAYAPNKPCLTNGIESQVNLLNIEHLSTKEIQYYLNAFAKRHLALKNYSLDLKQENKGLTTLKKEALEKIEIFNKYLDDINQEIETLHEKIEQLEDRSKENLSPLMADLKTKIKQSFAFNIEITKANQQLKNMPEKLVNLCIEHQRTHDVLIRTSTNRAQFIKLANIELRKRLFTWLKVQKINSTEFDPIINELSLLGLIGTIDGITQLDSTLCSTQENTKAFKELLTIQHNQLLPPHLCLNNSIETQRTKHLTTL